MISESNNKPQITAQHYAAFAVAIGWLRGALHSVIEGDFSKEHIKRVYEATATVEIARALGKQEGDLAIDWNEYLTEEQKHQIGGDEI